MRSTRKALRAAAVVGAAFVAPALAQTEVGGRIATDTTWLAANSPYIVTSDVEVYGDTSPFDDPEPPAVLTIEAGVEVRFAPGTGLRIGKGPDGGGLVAIGTAAEPIRFTAFSGVPLPGHWRGIDFEPGSLDAVSVVAQAVVEYAGASGYGIRIQDASPNLLDSQVRDVAGDCLTIAAESEPLVSASVFADCTDAGVQIDGADPVLEGNTFAASSTVGIRVTGSSAPTLTGNTFAAGAYFDAAGTQSEWLDNTFTDGGVAGSLIPAGAVDSVLATSAFTGVDPATALPVLGEAVTVDATWSDPGFPLRITSTTTLRKDATTPATLTLAPGLELRFDGGASLQIGTGAAQGGLHAVGTPSAPIRFTTSQTDAPAAGQWGGVVFAQGTSFDSVLEHAVVDYGGEGGAALVRLDGSGPVLRNVTLHDSGGAGIHATASAAVIDQCSVVDNAGRGVYDNGASELVLTGNTIERNGDYGLRFTTTSDAVVTGNAIAQGIAFDSAAGAPTVSGNAFTDWAEFTPKFGAGTVGQLADNDWGEIGPDARVAVLGERVDADATWSELGFSYDVVAGTVVVAGTTEAAATLTIEAGTVLRFARETGLQVGSNGDAGALVAVGSATEPIVFTSSRLNPVPGDWNGLSFDSGTVDETTVVEHAVVDYAGQADSAAVRVTGSSPTFRHCTVRQSGVHGFLVTDAAPRVEFCTVADNLGYGLQAESSSTPALHQCELTGNGSGAVNQVSSSNLDARLNWWGAAGGPSGEGPGSGGSVSVNVVYEPWLEAPVDPVSYVADLFVTAPAFAPGSFTAYFGELSEPGDWTLEILDTAGAVVRTLTGSGQSLAPIFNGGDGLGGALDDGVYSYRLFAVGSGSGVTTAAAVGDIELDSTLSAAEITNLDHLATYREGTVLPIVGSAEQNGFTQWTLLYGTGLFPRSFTTIATGTNPVSGGEIGAWDTTGLTRGTYALRLLVDNDTGGRTAFDLGSVVLAVNTLVVGRAAFSPNGDGVKDDVTVTATLSTAADWTLDVRDAGGATVRSFSGSGDEVRETWDGTLTGGGLAPEGGYSFRLTAMVGGTQVVVPGDVTVLDVTPPVADVTAPEPGAAVWGQVDVRGTATDPDGGFQEYAVEYGIGSDPLSYTTIGGSGANPVVNGRLARWTTTNTAGDPPVRNAPYTLRLTTNDVAGNVAVDSVLVELDNLILGNFVATPEQFDPTAGESFTVSYSVNKAADVALYVFREELGTSSRPVRVVSQSVPGPGDYTVTWNGRQTSGVIAPDDAYVWAMNATAEGGRRAQYALPGSPGVGANSGSIPGSYNPYTNDFWEIDLNVSSGGRVRMTVTPSGESGFTFIDREPYLPGVHRIVWEGRRPDGSIVETSSNVFFDAPATFRPNAVLTTGDTPELVDWWSDPYVVTWSYGQLTALVYELERDARVTIKVLPPGVYNPGSPNAVTLVEDELRTAGEHSVTWDGIDRSDPNGNLLLSSVEGAYSFVVLAVAPATGTSKTRYGVINAFR